MRAVAVLRDLLNSNVVLSMVNVHVEKDLLEEDVTSVLLDITIIQDVDLAIVINVVH